MKAKCYLTSFLLCVFGFTTLNAQIIVESFEADSAGTTPPTGWTAFGLTTWEVRLATGGAENGSVAITNADGNNVLVQANGTPGVDGGIYRSFDITGNASSPLEISILANDHGLEDGTLEGTDILFIDYAFGATFDPVNGSWLNAIQEVGDIVAGENNPEAFGLFTSAGSINGGGETTMWLRIRQEVDSGAEGFVVDNLQVTVIPEPSTAVLLLGGLGLLVALRRRKC